MKESWTSHENIVNKSSYENIVKKLCRSYEKKCEKVVLKWTICERFVKSCEQVLNVLWASHEEVMNKLCTNYKQGHENE